ncbi:unnamed protein product [Camellia sinensis]
MEEQQQQGDHRHHYQRLNTALQTENQQHHNQKPPQKCPRCDSLNTKFCYYNNYSLSQPRYFCKNCKRYWTHGGTLRNIPVGGGCRKAKRIKAPPSSGGENSRSQPAPPPKPPQGTMSATTSPYYSGGGSLSSLLAMQSLNQSLQPFNHQPLNVGDQFGFKIPFSKSQEGQNQQHNEFYQMGSRDRNIVESLVLPNRPIGSWINQSLIINNGGATNPSSTASNPSFLYTNTTNSGTVGTSLNPNQWADLQGYGSPP